MALTRRAKQWSRILGISPEQIEAGYQVTAENAAEIVREQAERVLKQVQSASATGALREYLAKKEQLPDRAAKKVHIAGEVIVIPAWRVYIENSPAHQGVVSGGQELNVFNLIDTGRKKLPKKPVGRAYLLWGWNGKSAGSEPALKVPKKSVRNERTGRFGYTQPQPRALSSYPERKEPRNASSGGNRNSAVAKYMQSTPYKREKNKGRTGTPRYNKASGGSPVSPKKGSRFTLEPGIQLFSRGPLQKIPPRKLYDRILRTAKDRLKGSGFSEWDVIMTGEGKK